MNHKVSKLRGKGRIMLVSVLLTWNATLSFGQGEVNWDWWCTNTGQPIGCPTDNWVDYIEISPGSMGPNALPVPSVGKGRVENGQSFELGLQAHFGDGDNTQNSWSYLNLNLARDIASLIVYMAPQEHFDVSDRTRDKRMLSGEYYEPEGFATGDVYFGFEIQILKDRPKAPDVLLRAVTKSASGAETGGARFTDTPGYFIDASAGKDFNIGKGNTIIRPYINLGFYAWQTYDRRNPQNDAPMYGIGMDLLSGKNQLSTSLAGYSGWKDNGDKPLVYRIEYLRKANRFNYLAQYQYGFNDYDYSSFKLSIIYYTENLFRKRKDGGE